MPPDLIRQTFMLVFVALAAWFDVRRRRIPNWLSVLGFAGGLVWAVFFSADDMPGGRPLAAFAVGVGILLILYLFKGVGAGDVKLLAGVSLLAGFPEIVVLLFYSCLAAAALMLVPLAWKGALFATLRSSLAAWRKKTEGTEKISLSFALALLVALVWVFVMEPL